MASPDDDFPRVLALYDYVARSDQELTFRAGDLMMVSEILSDDWYEGEINGTVGLIPAAYVRHTTDWRKLAEVQQRNAPPSPQLSKRKSLASSPSTGRASPQHIRSVGGSRSPRSSPRGSPSVNRRATAPQLSIPTAGMAEMSLSPRHGSPQGLPAGAVAVPGMGVPMAGMGREFTGHRPSGADRVFGPGASDDDLIKAKPLPRAPDQPDLAKALHIRNQAARVGPQKQSGGNELARHLQQLKTKKMYKDRVGDPHQAELQARLKRQSVQLDESSRAAPISELQRRMQQIAQPKQ